jgi:hypothetical protein
VRVAVGSVHVRTLDMTLRCPKECTFVRDWRCIAGNVEHDYGTCLLFMCSRIVG